MAEIRAQAGDFKSALLLLQESTQEAERDACRELAAHILKCRVIIEAGRGDTAEAARLCSETLPIYARTGDQMCLAGMLHALSGLLTDSGGHAFAGDPSDPQQIKQAAVLEGAAEALLRETGYGWPSPFPQPLKPLSAAEMSASLGAAAYAAALAEGQAMTIDEAIACAECIVRSVTADAAMEVSRQAAQERYAGLTAREREVATLIAQGCSNADIAGVLVLSERTVEAHVRNTLNKLGYDSRAQVAAWAVRVGLHS
jgi:non-specific serine/threonine protein kinase